MTQSTKPDASMGSDAASAEQSPDLAVPTLGEAFRVWLKIGLLSFGGPAGQIALMHRVLVEERRWIDDARFLHALNYCMLLPGPEAQQLATYIGWLLHRIVGGLIAGLLFILPGALVMLVLSVIYVMYAQAPPVAAVFVGVKAAVLIVVVEAVMRIGKRVLTTPPMFVIAGGAFIAIFALAAPFPLIVAAAAMVGLVGGLVRPSSFIVIKGHDAPGSDFTSVIDAMAGRGQLTHTVPSTRRTITLLLTFAVLWGGPVAALLAVLGPGHVLVEESVFFSKLAVVTFGGAYAVLAYMAQQAVEAYHWLSGAEMLDGLGLAETTPGPLIMVTQFVGFLGAYRQAGGADPMVMGALGALVVTWVTFAPCFLWIFLGAPYIERLRNNQYLSAALSGITAAVVGVILNLSVWFGLRVLFEDIETVNALGMSLSVPNLSSFEPLALTLTVAAGAAVFWFKRSVLFTLAMCAGAALAAHYILGATMG
jgi:chromate transporter